MMSREELRKAPRSENWDISLAKGRCLAFALLHPQSSPKQAEAWLRSQVLCLNRASREIIIDIHLKDPVLRMWRAMDRDHNITLLQLEKEAAALAASVARTIQE